MDPIYRRNDPGRKTLWMVIGVLSVLVVVLASALINKQPPPIPGPPAQQPPEARTEPPAPFPPAAEQKLPAPLDTTPIVVAGQGGMGCEAEEPAFDVTVMALGERAEPGASGQPLYLQDRDSVVRKYYLDNSGVPDDAKPRLAKLLVVGQHLKVRFVVCGSGGFRFLTFVQPTAAG